MNASRTAVTAMCSVLAFSILGGCITDGGAAAESESERAGWKGAPLDSRDKLAVAEGRRIAQRECAECHAIDQNSVSRDAGAPPFRDLVLINDPDWVAYRLIDGIRLGHDNMPLFDFDVRSADALMTYISSLND